MFPALVVLAYQGAINLGAHTGVGVGNLVDLVGVKPDLPLTALEDGRGQPLLCVESHPADCDKSMTIVSDAFSSTPTQGAKHELVSPREVQWYGYPD